MNLARPSRIPVELERHRIDFPEHGLNVLIELGKAALWQPPVGKMTVYTVPPDSGSGCVPAGTVCHDQCQAADLALEAIKRIEQLTAACSLPSQKSW